MTAKQVCDRDSGIMGCPSPTSSSKRGERILESDMRVNFILSHSFRRREKRKRRKR
jgi:hypothetical protein